MGKAIFPELRAIQRVMNTLEPFDPGEQKRILIVATRMLGYDWMNTVLPNGRARELLAMAQAAIRKAS